MNEGHCALGSSQHRVQGNQVAHDSIKGNGLYNCQLNYLLGNEQWRPVDSVKHSMFLLSVINGSL